MQSQLLDFFNEEIQVFYSPKGSDREIPINAYYKTKIKMEDYEDEEITFNQSSLMFDTSKVGGTVSVDDRVKIRGFWYRVSHFHINSIGGAKIMITIEDDDGRTIFEK